MTTLTPGKAPYRRIATEEAFAPPEMIDIYRRMTAGKTLDDPGFNTMWSFYLGGTSDRGRFIIDGLQDMETQRLAHMDAAGVDMQILSLTSPGVQVMNQADAVSFARYSNDWLAQAIARHPDRFAGLAAAAPQDPSAAAREIQRGVTELGLKGVIINSHTHGEYLSDPKFWEIFEAAEALDVPIYLHPMTPPKNMVQPLLECGLDGAIFGFGVETGMHALRIITAGVFDRFPKLQMILGHMGEALPFWMFRLDYMHTATVRSRRYPNMQPLERKPSDYLKQNFYITNSGMAWEPAVKFTQEQIGEDRVMYAMDYPYQYDPSEVVTLDNMNISEQAKKKFFESNAARLFKLD